MRLSDIRPQFEEETCNRGGMCNFMHIMKPSKSIYRSFNPAPSPPCLPP